MTSNLPVAKTQAATMLAECLPAMIKAYPSDSEAKRERFAQIATTIANSSELSGCQPKSVMMSIYGCMKLGLVPDPSLGHVYILPQKIKGVAYAQIRVGYRGYIELAGRSNVIAAVHAQVVYNGDEFDEDLGTERRIVHRPWYVSGPDDIEPGIMRLAYVTWRDLRSGTTEHHVVTRQRIKRAKDASQSSGSSYSPWNKDEAAMWRKTAIIDASKMWPLTAEIADAVHMDEQADLGRVQIIDAPEMSLPGTIDEPDDETDALLDGEVSQGEAEQIKQQEIEDSKQDA